MQNPDVFADNPAKYGHWDTRPQEALWDKMRNHQSNDTKTSIVQFFWDRPPRESSKRRFSVQDIADYMEERELTPTKNEEIFDTEEDTFLDAKFLD